MILNDQGLFTLYNVEENKYRAIAKFIFLFNSSNQLYNLKGKIWLYTFPSLSSLLNLYYVI